ncbi:MAG: protease complex subunit PrcB family protein [Clostridium sp.]
MGKILNVKRWGVMFMTVCLLAAVTLSGCGDDKDEEKKKKDLDFTVVGQNEIPGELAEIIVKKKAESFRLTYTLGDDLYIAAGYGEQKTGGYSISVPELYLTENSIAIKTELKGPGKEEQAGPAISYPFIVIKTEFIDKPIVFK